MLKNLTFSTSPSDVMSFNCTFVDCAAGGIVMHTNGDSLEDLTVTNTPRPDSDLGCPMSPGQEWKILETILESLNNYEDWYIWNVSNDTGYIVEHKNRGIRLLYDKGHTRLLSPIRYEFGYLNYRKLRKALKIFYKKKKEQQGKDKYEDVLIKFTGFD